MKASSLVIYVLGFIILNSCKVRNNTPEKYKNTATVSSALYNEHKTALLDSIQLYINRNANAYYPKENDSLTLIFIDTILYSSKNDKLAFFVITKNSNNKLASKGSNDEFHYDAHCFISYLNGIDPFNLKWLSDYNLIGYSSKGESSKRIREIYFKEFNQRPGGIFKYNLDDVRFWNDPRIWEEAR